ncbi:MAG: prepilin peptidase [Candidatus Korobacteraceae bacterium]
MDLAFECALFIVGLAFGSFLNVCISRIPRDQSIVCPRSRCPACGAFVRWYDNIPLLSWVLLRRRCRDCGQRISLRYPAVELLTAVLFAACYVSFGPALITAKFCIFCFLLVGLIFMDAETGLLPREFTYPGILLGLTLSWIAPTDNTGTQFLLRAHGEQLSGRSLALLDSVIGTLVGAGFFYLAWALYYLLRKRHGMGFGDIALMAMAGAFLGLKLTLVVIFSAPLTGAVYGAFLLVRGPRGAAGAGATPNGRAPSSVRERFLTREIPFGVFLGVCSLAAVFLGEPIWRWYLSFF